MKSKKITKILPIILVSLLAIYLVLERTPGRMSISSPAHVYLTEDALPPIDSTVSTFLPQWKYQNLSDSLERERQRKNGTLSHSGIRSLHVGSIRFAHWEDKKYIIDSVEQVLVLGRWKLKKESDYEKEKIYFVENGQSYLRSRICKPSSGKRPGTVYKKCQEIDTKIPFRYDLEEDAMVIPISLFWSDILTWFSYILIGVLFIFALYFILLTFIKFLRDIAYGDPFSKVNVNRLKKIAISILVVPAIELFLTLIVRLIYADHFTTDIELDPEIWSIFIKPVIISLIFVALHIAFKKGQELQEEANLTV